jgi:ubiquinone biosynthesis protein UbiJ
MAPLEWLIARMLERACAQARDESARAAELMRALAGKRLAIRVLGTPWAVDPILIESDGGTLVPVRRARSSSTSSAASEVPVAAGAGAPELRPSADATLIGAPLALLALAGTDPRAPIRRGDVRIEGDAELAQQYRELAAVLVPDFEDGLARLMGRSAAHLATRAARGAAGLARHAAWNSVQNLAEYLAHESGDLVSRHEAEHFLRGVDELRERSDRLDARLSDLENRAQALTDATGPR